jgi:PKD repeat protein
LVVICLLTVPALAFAQASVNVEDATTVVGGTTTVDVTVSAVPPPGVTDIQGVITYDPTVVHITNIQGLNGFSDFFFKAIDNVTGTANVTAAIIGGNGVLAGEVLRIFVEAVGGAGDTSFIGITLSGPGTVFRDADGVDIPVTVDPGLFTIGTTVPPVSEFTFAPTDPTTSDPVIFTDQSWDLDGIVVAWNWTFGDGGASTNQNPVHQYANGGSFNVTLTVTDDDGATDTSSQTVDVLGPSAAFNYTPAGPTTQDEVQFLDQSFDPTGNIVSWNWAFGDGTFSSQQNPRHTYAQPGTYRVDLTITSSGGATVSTFRRIVVRNAPPTAAFTFNPAQPKIGQMVTFGAGGSSDPDGAIVVYEWDFNNDGVTDATGATVTHSFNVVGARPVTLKVTDDDGAFDFVTHVVPVQASPPVAAFTFSPENPTTGQTVSFDASDSEDEDGTIILYEWDFDNDGITDATGMAATFSWPAPGVYPVTLLVTDNDGAFGAETHGVPVQVGGTGGDNQPPVADFTIDPQEGDDANINEVINFHSNGSSDPDGTIAAYEWDFDDDGDFDATGANAAHVYLTGGAKLVTLRVTDNDGAFGFKTRVVSVEFNRPTAVFSFEPEVPKVGEVVSFDASDSFDDDGRVDFFEWDFDDDGEADATGMNVNHIFDVGGAMPVTLMVIDNDGVTDFHTMTVPVEINAPPEAAFTYAPQAPTTADTVTFTDQSIDFDGTIEAWRWQFGTGATSTVQTATYRYEEAGTYEVTLTVTDDEGAMDTVMQEIIVGASVNTAPVANFAYAPALPQVDEEIQFTDQSTDAEDNLNAWAWDFGDGTTSTQRNPTHTYDAIGTYAVTLTVTDDEGASAELTRQVVVAETGAQIGTFAFPNPAATAARIVLAAPEGATELRLRVFDIRGELVFSEELAAATTEYRWNLTDGDGEPLPSGIYFYVISGVGPDGGTIRSAVFKLLIVR